MILDLKRNRYFGVGARETRALRVLAANWSEACTQAAGVIEPMASAEAMRLADALEAAGLLTRVGRMKERKKFGLRGARRGTQFSKR